MCSADMRARAFDPQIAAIFAVEAANTLVVQDDALFSKNVVDTAIAVAHAERRDVPDAVPKEGLIVTGRPVTVAGPLEAQRRTATALADPVPCL